MELAGRLGVIRRPPQRRLARLSATRGSVTAEYILLSGLVALGVVAGLLSFSEGPVQGALHAAGQRLTCFVTGASNCGGTSSPAPRNAAPPLHSEAEEIQRVEGGLEMDAERLDVDGVGVTELDPAAFSGMDRTEIRTALIEAGIPPTQAALRAGAIYRANHPGLDGVQVADTSGAWDFSTRTTPVEPVTGRPIPPVPPGHANTNTPPIRIVAGTAIDGTSRAPVQVVHPQPNVVGSAFKRAGGNILAALATGVVFAAADYYFTPEVARLPEVEGDFSDYQLDAEGRWLVDLDGNPVRRLSEHRLLGFSWGRHLVMNNDHELFYLHNNWTFRSHPVPPEAMLPGATAQDLVDAALAAQHNPEGWNTPWTATELFDPASHRADSLRRFVWTERGGATFEWDPEQQRWVQIGGVALLPEELLMAANSLGAGPPGALAPTLETTMSAGGGDGPSSAGGQNGESEEVEHPRTTAMRNAEEFHRLLRREVLGLPNRERAAALQHVMDLMATRPQWGFRNYDTPSGGTAYVGLQAFKDPGHPTFPLLYLSPGGRLFIGRTAPQVQLDPEEGLPPLDRPLSVDSSTLVPMLRPGDPYYMFNQAARELIQLEHRVGWEFLFALHGWTSIPRQLRAKVLPLGRGGYAILNRNDDLLVVYANGTVLRGGRSDLAGIEGVPFDELVGMNDGNGAEATPVSLREDHSLWEPVPRETPAEEIIWEVARTLRNRGVDEARIAIMDGALRQGDYIDPSYLLRGLQTARDDELAGIIDTIDSDLQAGHRISRTLDDVFEPILYREALHQAEEFAGRTLGWDTSAPGLDYRWVVQSGSQIVEVEASRRTPRRPGWNRIRIETNRRRNGFYVPGDESGRGLTVTPNDLAALIRGENAHAGRVPIELQADHAAEEPRSGGPAPAQLLADALGVPVIAPMTLPMGTTVWRTFVPPLRP